MQLERREAALDGKGTPARGNPHRTRRAAQGEARRGRTRLRHDERGGARAALAGARRRRSARRATASSARYEARGEGRGRPPRPEHPRDDDAAPDERCRHRDDRLRRADPQRRHEGPHHRPRGPQYPRPRVRHRRRPHHRRHAGRRDALGVRPGAPRDRPRRPHEAGAGRPHPPDPHRGGGREGAREVDASIKTAGEQAAIEAGCPGLHPEILRTLGKLQVPHVVRPEPAQARRRDVVHRRHDRRGDRRGRERLPAAAACCTTSARRSTTRSRARTPCSAASWRGATT